MVHIYFMQISPEAEVRVLDLVLGFLRSLTGGRNVEDAACASQLQAELYQRRLQVEKREQTATESAEG